MAYQDMVNELTGAVVKLPFDYAKKLVNRAWGDVRRNSLWSFNMGEGNWTSPGIINVGTVTTTQGANTIVFDATATTAINAVGLGPPSLITQRQFRIGVGTIYNIWGTNAASPNVTLTLDRNYQEPSATGSAYSIFQCYYPAPVQDWRAWLGVRDMVNFNNLITTRNRDFLDRVDPQRLIYYIPTHVVPYETDMNPNSPTYRYQLFELWGQPVFELTYQLWYTRHGLDLVNPTDTLPPQIGENLVTTKARVRAYEWAEANKVDPEMTRSDWMALTRLTEAEFKVILRDTRRDDRQGVNNFVSKVRRYWAFPNIDGWYNSVSGSANPGQPW